MEYGANGEVRPVARLDAENAVTVSAILHALATPSRLLILAQLREGPLTVSNLAATIGLKQPIVSQHLGLLRAVGLVTGTRHGRSVIYSLCDNHVAQLLDEVAYHSEQLRLGIADRPDATG
jgi:DNA-binding transcriptional ArsR family regulator